MAKIKDRVISLQEANDMIVGLKGARQREPEKGPYGTPSPTLFMEAQKYRE